ncbi:MAG: hypothetical protein B7Z26_00230 [Asticcacaulis sp. 32-58-5]|nr:MAG: hypothetical protein B7Z26_00230 [Asticcacaulis sp. 32-58-5]
MTSKSQTADRIDIAVIGAGVAGLTAALSLQTAGFSVTLFDKMPFPPENTSAIAGGMLAPFSESDVLPSAYILAGLKGIALWKGLLGDQHAACLHVCGSLVLASQTRPAEFGDFAEPFSHTSHSWLRLDAEAISRLEPDLARDQKDGIYLPDEAHLNPEKALAILFARFLAAGGHFHIREVRPEDLADQFDRIVDCRGYIGDLQPDLRAVQGEIVFIQQPEVCLSRPVRVIDHLTPFYIVPRGDGGFAIGATAIANADINDWRIRVSSALRLLAFATDLVPGLKQARITGMSSGLRSAYPNLLPEIRLRNDGRTIQINGLYRHGYLLSPVMAKCVVATVRGEFDEFLTLFSGKMNVPAVSLAEDKFAVLERRS